MVVRLGYSGGGWRAETLSRWSELSFFFFFFSFMDLHRLYNSVWAEFGLKTAISKP